MGAAVNDGRGVAVGRRSPPAAVARRAGRAAELRRPATRVRGQAPQFGALLWRRTAPESTPPAVMAPHGSGANAVPAAAVARAARSGSTANACGRIQRHAPSRKPACSDRTAYRTSFANRGRAPQSARRPGGGMCRGAADNYGYGAATCANCVRGRVAEFDAQRWQRKAPGPILLDSLPIK